MKHCYDFEKEISRWDESIPLGNGQIGALLWGKPDALRVSLDRSDIWDTTPCPETKKAEFSYSNMVKLVKEGNLEEIRRIFDGPLQPSDPLQAARRGSGAASSGQVEGR